METEAIVFLALVAVIVLVTLAWTFATRDRGLAQFWIERTGRRASGPPSTTPDNDRAGGEPGASAH
jgi:hypothetical protein